MNQQYNLSLFIFRRDLRLHDNTALLAALKQSEKVLPCFIFDPQQISDKNTYKSDNALQFMIDSLDDLSNQLKKQNGKLYLLHGAPTDVITKLIKKHSVEAIFVNHDYTPFSKKRDAAINAICKKYEIDFHTSHDYLLTNPDQAVKKDGTAYKIFTPFYKAMSASRAIKKPEENRYKNYFTERVDGIVTKYSFSWNVAPQYTHQGGRKSALKILGDINSLNNYENIRNFPALKTSQLSAHHKFGTCSIRESYYAIAKNVKNPQILLKQLYWRDFFTIIAYYYPHVFGKAFNEKYSAIKWSHNTRNFELWSQGMTGYPIVDAGMRELNQTGYMHNRVRMIVASFLTKTLGIDWLWGEKYFAQQLVDYDPSVNNGSWQWVASTGCDAQPYFRIFNPWLQQKKFDPECLYIKKWIPELKNIDSKILHKLDTYELDSTIDYPQLMTDYHKQRDKIISMFKRALK